MTYPAFLFLGCFLIEGFKSRHTFLGPTTMDNDLTLAKNTTIDFLIPSQIKKLIVKSCCNVNDIDIKSHLATSLLGSSKRSKILLRGNWMLSCNPGVWTFG